MKEPDISFHGLKKYFTKPQKRRVICMFETDRFGIYQVECLRTGLDSWRVEPLNQEPSMNFLMNSEREYVERVCRIVWRMVFDTPKASSRFEV